MKEKILKNKFFLKKKIQNFFQVRKKKKKITKKTQFF